MNFLHIMNLLNFQDHKMSKTKITMNASTLPQYQVFFLYKIGFTCAETNSWHQSLCLAMTMTTGDTKQINVFKYSR